MRFIQKVTSHLFLYHAINGYYEFKKNPPLIASALWHTWLEAPLHEYGKILFVTKTFTNSPMEQSTLSLKQNLTMKPAVPSWPTSEEERVSGSLWMERRDIVPTLAYSLLTMLA